jgi:hypothetical protein
MRLDGAAPSGSKSPDNRLKHTTSIEEQEYFMALTPSVADVIGPAAAGGSVEHDPETLCRT